VAAGRRRPANAKTGGRKPRRCRDRVQSAAAAAAAAATCLYTTHAVDLTAVAGLYSRDRVHAAVHAAAATAAVQSPSQLSHGVFMQVCRATLSHEGTDTLPENIRSRGDGRKNPCPQWRRRVRSHRQFGDEIQLERMALQLELELMNSNGITYGVLQRKTKMGLLGGPQYSSPPTTDTEKTHNVVFIYVNSALVGRPILQPNMDLSVCHCI
jgi:hypothetical protein